MNLYIITRGRVGNIKTLECIPTEWLDKTYLVHAHGEVHDYPLCVEAPPQVDSYSKKVQWMLHLINSFPSRRGLIMDDDLWFDKRTPEGLRKLGPEDDLSEMFNEISGHLNYVPLVGVHPRMMGQHAPVPYKEVGKIVCLQAVNFNLFPGMAVPKVDYSPILADVFLNCYLLSRGLPNRLVTNYVVNWGPSQATGGCDYRTIQMQADATAKVAEMYGPYAKQVWKRAKQENWLGEDGRPDLRVQWRKLYKERPNA